MKHLRALSLAFAMVLSISFATPAFAVTEEAHEAGNWLSKQLEDGLLQNAEFGGADYGLSIDALISLEDIDGFDDEVTAIADALENQIRQYIEFEGDEYAGSTAKALVAAVTADRDPAKFGGVNLTERLEGLIADDTGAGAGRIADKSAEGEDYANTVGQAYAVWGLAEVESSEADSVTGYLLQQQCADGYFRLNFNDEAQNKSQTCDDGDTEEASAPDTDATALALIALANRDDDAEAEKAVAAAAKWLEKQQADNGSFGGGTSTEEANANSTGLAAAALDAADRDEAAAKAGQWIAGLQISAQKGERAPTDAGAVAYDKAGHAAAKDGRINPDEIDQWRRATAQSIPALEQLGSESQSSSGGIGVQTIAIVAVVVFFVVIGSVFIILRRRNA